MCKLKSNTLTYKESERVQNRLHLQTKFTTYIDQVTQELLFTDGCLFDLLLSDFTLYPFLFGRSSAYIVSFARS